MKNKLLKITNTDWKVRAPGLEHGLPSPVA